MNAGQRTMQQQARVIFSTGSLYLLDLAYCFELAAEAGFDGIGFARLPYPLEQL